MKQKLAALFVMVAMALCVLPMAAFAEEPNLNDPNSWISDRTEPQKFTIADGKISFGVAAQPAADDWYAWQGRKAYTNAALSSAWKITYTFDITQPMLEQDNVNASLWIQVDKDGTNGAASQEDTIDWAIVQFINDSDNGGPKWQAWNSSGSGSWVDIPAIGAAVGTYTIDVEFSNGTITQYINGTTVNSYAVSEVASIPAALIVQGRSYGAAFDMAIGVPSVTLTPVPTYATPSTVKIGSKDFQAVFANGKPARVYEQDGATLVDVTDENNEVTTYKFTSDLRAVFGGSNAVEGGVAKLPETNIVMDGGKVNYLFGASHTSAGSGSSPYIPISVDRVSITVNGGTVNMVQTAEQGGGMGSFDKCGDYYVDISDIEINGGKIGAVVGGAYGYTQVEHVFVTVNGGEINPGDLTSPVQAGILLAGTNGKVGTATLHMKNGTVNGLAVGQRCYVTSGVTYNMEGGSVGDVYLGSYYPVATEGSAAWENWGTPTYFGNINYGQVAGKFTVNISGTKLNGLYPGYQYLLSEREAIKNPALVSGSIPAGADNADTAKTPVSIALFSNAQPVPSYILGNTAVTLTPNHRYELTAGGSDSVLSTMTSEVISPVTVVNTSVDIPASAENVFDALLSGDENTGCVLNDAAKAYIANNKGSAELKVLVTTSNLADADVPAAEKALITAKGSIAQYIDISLALSDKGALVPDTAITKIGQPLNFTVEIPASLVKDGRTFKIVSVHEGKLIEHPTTVSTENGVTLASFSSDSFSTYGLIYTDASSGNNDNNNNDTTPATPAPAQVLDSTPKTGAVSLVVLPLAGLAFAGLGFVTRKREE